MEWDLSKISKNLTKYYNASPNKGLIDAMTPAILITTGAMNPMHIGHVDMLARARRMLENEYNFIVLGGVISPTHGTGYVQGKLTSKTNAIDRLLLNDYERTELINSTINGDYDDDDDDDDDDSWLTCGEWEINQSDFVDFPYVVENFRKHVYTNSALAQKKPKIFYVCGYDHWDKTKGGGVQNHPDQGIIVIPREISGHIDFVPTNESQSVYGVTERNELMEKISSTSTKTYLKSIPNINEKTGYELYPILRHYLGSGALKYLTALKDANIIKADD